MDKSIYLKRLVSLVNESGLSRVEIGKIIGVNRNTVGTYLSGKASIKLEALEALAKYFHVPLSYFFSDESVENTRSDFEDPLVKQLLDEKDKRISELKDQLTYLKKFYDQFSEEVYGKKRTG